MQSPSRAIAERRVRAWDIYGVAVWMFLLAAGEILGVIVMGGGGVFFGAVWVDANEYAALIHVLSAAVSLATGVALLLRSRYGLWMFGALTAMGLICRVVWWTHGRAVVTAHGLEPCGWERECSAVVWYVLSLAWCWFRRDAFKPSVKG